MKKKKKLVPSIQHAPYKFIFILSLLLGEKRLWEGMKVLMGKSGGKSVARLDSHVLLSCIFPPNSVIFASPFQNGPLFEGAKNNETRKYTPNTQVLNGPFQLVLFVSPFNFRPCDVTPENCFFSNFVLSTCICMYNFRKDRRRIPLRTSRSLNWENKTCKPKRPISYCFEAEGKKPKEIALSLKDE